MRVQNRKILRTITWRSLKASRFRNLIAIIAIILTSVMFTTIATMGSALIQTAEEEAFRQVGTSSHGGFKYLTQAQYDKINATGAYQDISYNIVLGALTNPELQKKPHEVRYFEDKEAQWDFCYPTTGTMPKEYRDVAMATTTLDLLGLPHELGQTIHLDIDMDGVSHSDDFTLVGIWSGDDVMMATEVLLSKEYVRDLAPSPETYVPGQYSGLIDASVWFDSPASTDEKLIRLTSAAGLDPEEIETGINWAYTTSGDMDMTTLLLVGTLLIIIMVSGYLIIYSIFFISISGDIRFYGLLKTIGTTGRQIKGIVRGQALLLSAIGIPLGLGLGFLLGTQLVPVVFGISTMKTPTRIQANPQIFLLSALFSLVTVFLSCRKPGKIAAKVSPIEAVRFQEYDNTRKKERKGKKTRPSSMALANINRSKRKLITVILSLSLSLILLNSIVAITDSFDMDKFVQIVATNDFLLTDYSMLSPGVFSTNYEAVPPELIDAVAKLPGLEAYSRIYFMEAYTEAPAQTMARYEKIMAPYLAEKVAISYNYDGLIESSTLQFHLYGYDALAFESVERNYQDVDWEKFASGRYVLMNAMDADNDTYEDVVYDIGDMVPVVAQDGTVYEYELLGYIRIPYALTCQHVHFVEFDLIISSDNFVQDMVDKPPMSLIFDVDDAHIASTEEWLKSLCENEYPDMNYRSKAYYVGEFQSMLNAFTLLGSVLVFILAIIGVLNFINAMATSIMSRRRELAMMQSIGMTNQQLRRMLFYEGIWHALLTLGFTLTLGLIPSALLMEALAGEVWFFTFRFTAVPILICAPILILLCAIVPLACARRMHKTSIVERIREN